MVAATLDDVPEGRQVVGKVRAGIDERVANAGLRREMDHLPERAVGEKARRRSGIGSRSIRTKRKPACSRSLATRASFRLTS